MDNYTPLSSLTKAYPLTSANNAANALPWKLFVSNNRPERRPSQEDKIEIAPGYCPGFFRDGKTLAENCAICSY